jgi:hypothetical protein
MDSFAVHVDLVDESDLIDCRFRRRLTLRWSGRVRDKVPSSNAGARAALLNR